MDTLLSTHRSSDDVEMDLGKVGHDSNRSSTGDDGSVAGSVDVAAAAVATLDTINLGNSKGKAQ